MTEKYKYKLTYMVKAPDGSAQAQTTQYLTSDPNRIGHELVEKTAEFGTLHNLQFSFIPCPVCGRCSACGQK